MSPHLSLLPRHPTFNPQCPEGGNWYACGRDSATRFVGCCTRDPCSTMCAKGDIRPAAFDPNAHGTFPDVSCGAGIDPWTCASGAKTFMGCCKSNPCINQTCPLTDLEPATMTRDDQFAAFHAGGHGDGKPKKKGSATPKIAGGVVGGIVGLALIIGLIWFFMKKKKAKETGTEKAGAPAAKQTDTQMVDQTGLGAPGSPPPQYGSPNPNTYDQKHGSQFYGYGGYPQEQYKHEGSAAAHPHRVSELSNEVTISELPATSMGSIPEKQQQYSPMHSPQTGSPPAEMDSAGAGSSTGDASRGLGIDEITTAGKK